MADDSLPIDSIDAARLVEILAAIREGNWERFKFLSDEPFINEEAMREQFEETCPKVDLGKTDLYRDAMVGVDEDGTRLITVLLKNKNRTGEEIVLLVHTAGGDGPRRFGIWAFFEHPNLDI